MHRQRDIASIVIDAQIEKEVERARSRLDSACPLKIMGGELLPGLSGEQMIDCILRVEVMMKIALTAGMN